jgi:hypothetical protein
MKRLTKRLITIISILCLPGTVLPVAGEETNSAPRTLTETLFTAMDYNSDLKVSKDEYFAFGEAYMQEKGKPFNPTVAQRNFSEFDANGNGYIEPDDARADSRDPRTKTLEGQKKGGLGNIVGVWRHWDDRTSGFITFVFTQDGEADMVNDNVSTRSMAIAHGGSMTYTYDPSTDPASLDIVAVGGSGPATKMRCIVQFLTEDRIKVRMAHGQGYVKRPKGFVTPSMADTLTLRRTQQNPSKMSPF